MAAQVMARVGKEQQVKDVENRSIANFKQESLQQGLILHPLLLRRYFSAFRTVQVRVFALDLSACNGNLCNALFKSINDGTMHLAYALSPIVCLHLLMLACLIYLVFVISERNHI
jgi:hypothetical protein